MQQSSGTLTCLYSKNSNNLKIIKKRADLSLKKRRAKLHSHCRVLEHQVRRLLVLKQEAFSFPICLTQKEGNIRNQR